MEAFPEALADRVIMRQGRSTSSRPRTILIGLAKSAFGDGDPARFAPPLRHGPGKTHRRR
jgi:hypothetical protein